MKAPTLIVALLAGVLFGFGLGVFRDGQARGRPRRSCDFQDFGLLFVLGGAAVVTAIAYHVLPRIMAKPVLGGAFGKHPRR